MSGATGSGWRVVEVPTAEVLPLRAMVLRPGWGSDMCEMPGDTKAGTFHLGARRDSDGAILAVMTMMVDDTPAAGSLTPAPAWRIRGMASHPEARGMGCGKALVVEGCARVWGERKDPVWCNARRVAYGFYEKLGFRFEGGEFEIEGIGPHMVMVRDPE